MLFVCARSIGRILNYFLATVVEELCGPMVLKNVTVCLLWTVFAWADCSGNLMFYLETNGHVFCIESEIAVFLMSPRSVSRIVNDFLTTVMEELCGTMVLKNMIVSLLWTVFARANSSGNLMLLLETNSHFFGIVTEVAMFFMCARSIGRIVNDFLATVVEELCGTMVFKNVIVCLLWTVFAWANSFGNLMLLLETDSHVFGIVTEVAMFFMCARSIGRIVNDFLATVVEELVFSMM
jgi:hypothetical protein